MSRLDKTARATKPSVERAAAPSGDPASKERVIEAAVACILERGFYRASTNEIARRAGVSWGVIQHYFGTREALMLSVLQDGARQFVELVEGVHVSGDTVERRIGQLIDVLAAHYARPDYLAYLQIMLNMDGDPQTSADVHETMREVAEKSHTHVRRLLRETLGSAAAVPDLSTTVFLILRGFGLSQHLLDTMAYDALAPKQDRVARQRRLLAKILTAHIELLVGEGT